MGHEIKQHMLILRAYPDEWASDWSEELKIEAAQDLIAPLAPSGFALSSVAEGIELTWTNPTLNFDGTDCNDLAWIAVYRKADSGSIDPDDPGSYDKRTLIQGESYIFPSTATGTTFYFLLTALDRTGNESEVTSELDEEPGAAVSEPTAIPDDATGLIFKDAIGGDGVVSGHAMLGIAFNAPADAWVNFDRYRLWWQYSTDGSIWRDEDGVQDQWTEIASVDRRGFLHKGLDSTGAKAYRYKATVKATDGTESSTADTAGGAATTADAADNTDVVAITIFAMNIVCLGEVTANDITCTNLAAINADLGAATAGSLVVGTANKIWLNEGADGILAIGGSTKATAPFRVSAVGAVTCTNLTITGGSININSGVFTVSAAGAVVASSISCTNLAVGAGSTWEGNVFGTAYIPNLSAAKITTGTMVANRISGGTIGACTISANNITTGGMSAARITTGTMVADRISTGTLGACTISASYITTGTLNCSLMTVSNLNASSITAGTLSATYISGGTLNCSLITVSNLSASSITAGTLSASYISGGTLNCSLITVSNLSASSITTGTMSAGRITTGGLVSAGWPTNGIGIDLDTGYMGCQRGGNPVFEFFGATGNLMIGDTGSAHYIWWDDSTGILVVRGTLTADDIVAGTLSATYISGGTLDFAAISRSALSVLNSELAGSITYTKLSIATLSSISANIGTVTAGTITGLTMQTASSGQRLVISPGLGTDTLSIYDATRLRNQILQHQINMFDSSGNLKTQLATSAPFQLDRDIGDGVFMQFTGTNCASTGGALNKGYINIIVAGVNRSISFSDAV